LPAGGVGFQAATDQVFAGSLHLTDADALARLQPLGLVQMIRVLRQIVPQLVEDIGHRGLGSRRCTEGSLGG